MSKRYYYVKALNKYRAIYQRHGRTIYGKYYDTPQQAEAGHRELANQLGLDATYSTYDSKRSIESILTSPNYFIVKAPLPS